MAPENIVEQFVSDDTIENKMYLIRNQHVMIDFDLSELYQVPTKRLNEQVKRNMFRFPEDFMFQLTQEEFETGFGQQSGFALSKRRNLPYAFTEHGVLMLSSVLNSETAIKVNIRIMRIYTRMRKLFLSNREIMQKLEQVEHMIEKHDNQINDVFTLLRELLASPPAERDPIGFRING